MNGIQSIFEVGWVLFGVYWLVAASSMKKGRVDWDREIGIRVVVVIAALLMARLGAFQGGSNSESWRIGLGLVLLGLGLGLAIWARVHMGRNWGTPMSVKEDPELVSSGPYRLVRHPIYTGILVAGVGTAVALAWGWLFAVALAGVYFIYSARVEEHNLNKQFPDQYPGYKNSTKMLVPFLF